MRISDWSSDVCSSDLVGQPALFHDDCPHGLFDGPIVSSDIVMGQAKVERCEVQIMRKQEFTNLLIQLGPPIFSAIVSARDFRFGLRRFFLTGRPLERKMLQPLEQSATRSGYRSWMLVPYRCRPICHVRQNGRTGPLLRRCLKYFQMSAVTSQS